jgi:hypothetical protein
MKPKGWTPPNIKDLLEPLWKEIYYD